LEELAVLRSFSRLWAPNESSYSKFLFRAAKNWTDKRNMRLASKGEAFQWVASIVLWGHHPRKCGIKFVKSS